MNIENVLKALRDKGFEDCEYANGMIKVYYESGDNVHKQVGEILKAAGYNRSYSTSGRPNETKKLI